VSKSNKKKRRPGLLQRLLDGQCEDNTDRQKAEPITLVPALQQIGITCCPICKHEVAVFLTRTKRPFVNCSFCSVRIFYNGRESMRRLKKKMELVGDGVKL
jgi:DNA-directed RNA polymerase subunit RPC12/RpoP